MFAAVTIVRRAYRARSLTPGLMTRMCAAILLIVAVRTSHAELPLSGATFLATAQAGALFPVCGPVHPDPAETIPLICRFRASPKILVRM